MARTPSTMLDLGTIAPNFHLPEPKTGRQVSLDDFPQAKGFLIVFMCNHCPYVKLIQNALAQFAKEYQPRGLVVIGINSNDVKNYPDDAPEKMIEESEKAGYVFPYLYDETQEIAKSYQAACTPDFFLFDQERKLVYRGQFDDSRPQNNITPSGKDLRMAADALLAGRPAIGDQKPSLGCNIKWKPNNEPNYS